MLKREVQNVQLRANTATPAANMLSYCVPCVRAATRGYSSVEGFVWMNNSSSSLSVFSENWKITVRSPQRQTANPHIRGAGARGCDLINDMTVYFSSDLPVWTLTHCARSSFGLPCSEGILPTLFYHQIKWFVCWPVYSLCYHLISYLCWRPKFVLNYIIDALNWFNIFFINYSICSFFRISDSCH